MTSPAIVGLNTILVKLCHPIEGLGGLLTDFFWRDGLITHCFMLFELPMYVLQTFSRYMNIL